MYLFYSNNRGYLHDYDDFIAYLVTFGLFSNYVKCSILFQVTVGFVLWQATGYTVPILDNDLSKSFDLF